ncbi:hypothetical protein SESBI_11377 [Sesbania bispinosa]|nr:hypothetical protein SESBI_11377 [Sesbania bispinosa]
MLTKLLAWKPNQVKEHKDAPKSINLHEEYQRALRTSSYAELLANQPSLNKITETFVEPGQETIASIVDSATISKKPELKNTMLSYFDISAEASYICSHLLKSINQVNSAYQFIQRALDDTSENSEEIIIELNSLIFSDNPFANLNDNDFMLINDKHLLVLHHLKSMRKKVGKKIKVIKYLKKASGICVTAFCGLIVKAAHTPTALIRGYKLSGSGSLTLSGVYDQLDIAAKGTYILNRDFETMRTLVGKVHDEIEHNRAMVQFCLERKEEIFTLQIVKELKKGDVKFMKQMEELEEQVYLCLGTINQARAWSLRK